MILEQDFEDTDDVLLQEDDTEDLYGDDEVGLKTKTELEFLFREFNKFPQLTEDEERLLTGKIFNNKIEILTNLAISEPFFLTYLNRMTRSSDKLKKNKEEEEGGEIVVAEDSTGRLICFTQYLNTPKGADGTKKKFDWFKDEVLNLRQKCLDIQFVSNTDRYIKQRQVIFDLLAEINFSWSQLEKDGLLNLIPLDNPTYAAFHKDVNKFSDHNMCMTMDVASKYFATHNHHSDLFQVGSIGLLTAVKRFDPRMGLRFSTYAIKWIKHEINRYISQFKTIRIPVHFADKISKMYHLESWHPQWNDEQIAKEMKSTPEKVNNLRLVSFDTHVASLDQVTYNHSGNVEELSRGYFVPDPVNVEKLILDAITDQEIIKMLKARLTKREYEIVARRFGLEKRPEESLEEISKDLGLTKTRIRQITDKAKKKLAA